jgi:hypothetical protein
VQEGRQGTGARKQARQVPSSLPAAEAESKLRACSHSPFAGPSFCSIAPLSPSTPSLPLSVCRSLWSLGQPWRTSSTRTPCRSSSRRMSEARYTPRPSIPLLSPLHFSGGRAVPLPFVLCPVDVETGSTLNLCRPFEKERWSRAFFLYFFFRSLGCHLGLCFIVGLSLGGVRGVWMGGERGEG